MFFVVSGKVQAVESAKIPLPLFKDLAEISQ
jgi:hypothetical protein